MNILAIVAHMDDAEIYCGGTLAKFKKRGDKVNVCVVTNGNKGSYEYGPEELTRIRREEQKKASRILGAEEPFFLDFEDDLLVDCVELRLGIIDAIRAAQPDIIITHYPHDGSNDHGMTGTAVSKALIGLPWDNVPVKNPPIRKMPQLFYMDTAGGIGFLPEVYVDISDVIDIKRAAFNVYKSQIKYDPRYAETIEVLSRFRGFQAGYTYGEGFIAHRFFGYMPDFRLLP